MTIRTPGVVHAESSAILIINEVPDIEPDRHAHKRTLVVRWGVGGARWIYWGLTVIALAASGAAIVRHVLPLWYALVAMAIAGLGLWAACGISIERSGRPRLKRSIELTLAIHALGCAGMIAAILIKPSL
jgi:1,4-dihydroxy-2-naphthoate octaprenyltransferase